MPFQMLISDVSRAVRERIIQQLGRKGQPSECEFAERLHEFDAVYLLRGSADGGLSLSFALPSSMDEVWTCMLLNASTRSTISTLYSGVATLEDPPEPGFQLTLRIDMAVLSKTELRDFWVERLAGVRQHVTGAPLRRHFLELAEGTIRAAPVEALCGKPGQVYFVKPQSDSVTVVLPMRFVSGQDAAIGHTFLQEFVEARRSASLGMSPTCSYHPAKSPPLELQGADPKLLGGATGGYVCFTFFKRHVCGSQLDHVLWSMTTFYTLIGYHIKACKAMMHGRMRVQLDSILLNLPPPHAQPLFTTSSSSTAAGAGAAGALPSSSSAPSPATPFNRAGSRTPMKSSSKSMRMRELVPDTLQPDTSKAQW